MCSNHWWQLDFIQNTQLLNKTFYFIDQFDWIMSVPKLECWCVFREQGFKHLRKKYGKDSHSFFSTWIWLAPAKRYPVSGAAVLLRLSMSDICWLHCCISSKCPRHADEP